jgi:heat-inducible transcriptional repressor
MTPLFPGSFVRTPGLADLDARARDIFKRVVESYLETGEPVGSRTLSRGGPLSRGGTPLSPASIRNTMQDLAQLGLLDAPHSSAGRMPTHAGLRMFVDGFLEVGDVGAEERQTIEARLFARGRSFEDALAEAGSILSGLAGGASIVVTPVREGGVKHVEFVALGGDQALAVMVFEDGAV